MSQARARARRGLLTRWELGLGVLLVGALLSWAIPVVARATWRTRCAEVGLLMSSLQEAEEAWRARTGSYVAVAGLPRSADRTGRHPAPWPATLPAGWEPPTSSARCSYSATPQDDGLLLVATCDVDGDGERSRFRLGPGGDVVQLTPDGVW
ncbi:MAG: hypothetical protein H6732_08175 [Alphaproteobacteria bacterium]|nr:hypothetical protein [Alphaproteobacteria bacterium]